MLHNMTRLHGLILQAFTELPILHAFKRVNFDGVVVATSSHLADTVERCMTDTETTRMFSNQGGLGPTSGLP